MKILVRGNKTRRWELTEPVATKAETELQHLLIESPSLIPISDIREDISPLVIAVDEFGLPGSGNTDLLAFTADGDIAIIECKLATNPDSKRKVIGQILEYASFLWGMSYQEVDGRIQPKSGVKTSDSESLDALESVLDCSLLREGRREPERLSLTETNELRREHKEPRSQRP